jgi:hypothetical protein
MGFDSPHGYWLIMFPLALPFHPVCAKIAVLYTVPNNDCLLLSTSLLLPCVDIGIAVLAEKLLDTTPGGLLGRSSRPRIFTSIHLATDPVFARRCQQGKSAATDHSEGDGNSPRERKIDGRFHSQSS